MKQSVSSTRTAAGVPAAVLLSVVFAAGSAAAGQASGAAPAAVNARAPACRIAPKVLDVGRPAGPLLVRIELPPAVGQEASAASLASPVEAVEPGVYIASVNGIRLPAPSAAVEGIGERVAGRSLEHQPGAPSGSGPPAGTPALVVRFDRPADGNAATREDGDAGDILAMLLGLPDGQAAPVCVAGRIDGVPFECCDAIELHNRGLRDLPRGLAPPASPS